MGNEACWTAKAWDVAEIAQAVSDTELYCETPMKIDFSQVSVVSESSLNHVVTALVTLEQSGVVLRKSGLRGDASLAVEADFSKNSRIGRSLACKTGPKVLEFPLNRLPRGVPADASGVGERQQIGGSPSNC